jgi:hypothetical protein
MCISLDLVHACGEGEVHRLFALHVPSGGLSSVPDIFILSISQVRPQRINKANEIHTN